MIRVVLVDDQVLLRRGLRGLLELDGSFTVVGEAGDGLAALELVREEKPDVLLLDVRMPKLDGIAVLRQLRTEGLETPAVLLTTFDDDSAFLEGAAAGASAFLLKDVSFERLCDVITRAANGERLLGPAIDERVLRALRALTPEALGAEDPRDLTPRERDVLRLMARGHSNREIAQALGTREGTVKNQASTIFSKLGVNDRTKAVLMALDLGWI